jgi:aryl-alcohol dehydrogenase-like predicted oxidoreductase
MSLPTSELGTSGMELTRVGFGAWAIGGGGWKFGWGPQDDDESIAAILDAVDRGVNWIDTAAVYGLGHSEEVVRRALAGVPAAERPLVFTKCGLVWDESDPMAPAARVMAPESVRMEIDASLTRLGVEQIDLYQVHWPPDDATPIEEYWHELAQLRESGKVRALGLSNHGVDLLERAEAVAHVDAIQPHFSMVTRDNAPELAWAAAHGTGVIVYSPMQSGLLTGAFSPERVAGLADDDWRKTAPDFTTGLPAILELVDALGPVAARHGVPVASVAVAWALAWPGVTGAIVGARNPKQIDGWLPAAGLRLTDEDHAEIRAAIAATGVGSGPLAP